MPTALPAFSEDSFRLSDDRQCDLVMKGGITSGVIYPLAVCELAQHYRLRSIGGASAGAIGAAVAAAAEVGRQSPGGPAQADLGAPATGVAPDGEAPLAAGFLGLSAFPQRLSAERQGRSLLLRLFRPQPQTRRLFEVLTGGLNEYAQLSAPRDAGGPGRKRAAFVVIARLLLRTAKEMVGRAVLGVLPGLLVIALGILGLVNATSGLSTAVAVVTVLLGAALGVFGLAVALLTAVLSDLRRLPAVDFGISSGRGSNDRETALTPWLFFRLQELARLGYDTPLTFDHLAQHQVELQVMTTNLSRLQPLSMPWTSYTYFFEERAFRALFGEVVVQAMVGAPPPDPTDADELHRWQSLVAFAAREGLRPMPPAAQLPVIVAVRMSLSFPILITAVPLYAVDRSTPAYADYHRRIDDWWAAHPKGTAADLVASTPADQRPDFAVNWFSDGGLTSNLPVQFFDGPLPTRPTFAIDLSDFSRAHPRSDDEDRNSFLRTDDGPVPRRTRDFRRRGAEPRSALGQLVAFAVALVETARTWVDEETLTMPGYRDRVVTVYQGGGEGGLNLDMPEPVVERLSQRGRFAARKLAVQFGPEAAGWPNQRWVRLRSTTSALSDWFTAFNAKYGFAVSPSYPELLRDPPSRPFEDPAAVRMRIDALRAEIGRWEQIRADLLAGRPQIPPVLRLTAPVNPENDSAELADPAVRPPG